MSGPPPWRFREPVTLVGNGALRRDTIRLARQLAPWVIAADGGAETVRPWRVPVAAIIGDLDSLPTPDAWPAAGTRVLRDADADCTDLEKCLRRVRAPLLLAAGFLGDRLDHSLAALGLAATWPAPLVLLGAADLVFAPPADWRAELPPGARLSILAMAESRVVRSEGLRWSAAGLVFRPGVTRGVANVVAAGPVRLAFDRPGALLVLENRCLPEVARSLGWPAALGQAESGPGERQNCVCRQADL